MEIRILVTCDTGKHFGMMGQRHSVLSLEVREKDDVVTFKSVPQLNCHVMSRREKAGPEVEAEIRKRKFFRLERFEHA